LESWGGMAPLAPLKSAYGSKDRVETDGQMDDGDTCITLCAKVVGKNNTHLLIFKMISLVKYYSRLHSTLPKPWRTEPSINQLHSISSRNDCKRRWNLYT